MPIESNPIRKAATIAMVVGTVASMALIAGIFVDRAAFFRAYLFAWLLWLGFSLGSMALVMLNHLTGGAWGVVIRRPAEAATMALPLLALMFVPIVFGLEDLYVWARPDEVARDLILQHKHGYLNVAFFLARAAVYFALWCALAFMLRSISLKQDHRDWPELHERFTSISAGGLVLFVLSMSLASVDWIMSRDPHWYSTVFGFIVIVGQTLSGLSLTIVILTLLARRPPMQHIVRENHLHDLGNLLMTVVILWTYVSLAQFLIIWMGNTHHEITWYAQRGLSNQPNGWQWVGVALLVLHFFVPFLLLLSRQNKRRAKSLGLIAAGVLLMRIVETFWLVAPSGPPVRFNWMDVIAPLAIGGWWMAAMLIALSRHALVPRHDPEMVELFDHEERHEPNLA